MTARRAPARLHHTPGLPALLACVVALGACSLNTKPEQPVVMASTGITKSADGMRLSVLARSQNAAEHIERTADTIAAQTRDPQVRRNAIQWKAVSTAELQTASLARDPVVSLGRVILFTLQSQAFFTTGEGRTMFGTQQPLAIQALDDILEGLLQYADAITPAGRSGWLSALQPWADTHPIKSPYVGRGSVLMDSLAGTLPGDRSALAAVGSMELTTRILDARVDQIQQTMLKEARWQAELLMADMAKQPVVDSLMGHLERVTSSVERLTGVAESTPDLVERERLAALLAVTQERIAILAGITGEREAVLAALANERATVIEALHEERVATLKDAEAAGERLIDHTLDYQLNQIINRVLLKVFLGVVALLLLGLGVGLILLTVARRPGGTARA